LLTTTAIYLLTEIQPSDQSLSIPTQTLREALLQTLKVGTRPNVQEAARLVLKREDSNPKETAMSFGCNSETVRTTVRLI